MSVQASGLQRKREKAAQSRSRRKRKYNWIAYFFVAPAVFLTVFVVFGATLATFGFSLTEWDFLRPMKFVGLNNYFALAMDGRFVSALLNNAKWVLVFCTIPITLGMTAAVLASRLKRGQMFFRTAFFIPYICSTVVTAGVWSWIFNPFAGINTILTGLGMTNPPNWLANTDWALFLVAGVDEWRFWGFLMVIFLSALHQTDRNLEEAARLDGANPFQIFFYVIIPQIRPTLVLVFMLTVIWSYKAFDYVFVMTRGGPGYSTEVIATYMYKLAFNFMEAGYASTVAVTMIVFAFIVMLVFTALQRRGWEI